MRLRTRNNLFQIIMAGSIIVSMNVFAQHQSPCKYVDENMVENARIEWDGKCKDGYIHGKGILRIFSGLSLYAIYHNTKIDFEKIA